MQPKLLIFFTMHVVAFHDFSDGQYLRDWLVACFFILFAYVLGLISQSQDKPIF
jgi:hypothetical protein